MPMHDDDREVRAALFDSVTVVDEVSAQMRALEFEPVIDFTTFFAEWAARDDDLVVHLFPRAGRDDQWTQGYFIPRCRRCRREVRVERDEAGRVVDARACSCGHRGLIYIPGRREQPSPVHFPGSIHDLVKAAADHVWEGSLAIERVDELGALALQFQQAARINEELRRPMLERFFARLDERLEATRDLR